MSTPLRERPDAPLGTLIFRAGLLPAETIENALEEGVKTGRRLGEILVERGLLQEEDLTRLLAGQKGLPFVSLRAEPIDPEATRLAERGPGAALQRAADPLRGGAPACRGRGPHERRPQPEHPRGTRPGRALRRRGPHRAERGHRRGVLRDASRRGARADSRSPNRAGARAELEPVRAGARSAVDTSIAPAAEEPPLPAYEPEPEAGAEPEPAVRDAPTPSPPTRRPT